MRWVTCQDGTRFLLQTPPECARSLARAFPAASDPTSPPRFIEQLKSECPPPERRPDGRRPGRNA